MFLQSGCATYVAYKSNREQMIEREVLKSQLQYKTKSIEPWTEDGYVGIKYNFGPVDVTFDSWGAIIKQVGGILLDVGLAFAAKEGVKYLKKEIESYENENKDTNDSSTTIYAEEGSTIEINTPQQITITTK